MSPASAPDCPKTQFPVTAHTIYCVCVIFELLYIVSPLRGRLSRNSRLCSPAERGNTTYSVCQDRKTQYTVLRKSGSEFSDTLAPGGFWNPEGIAGCFSWSQFTRGLFANRCASVSTLLILQIDPVFPPPAGSYICCNLVNCKLLNHD